MFTNLRLPFVIFAFRGNDPQVGQNPYPGFSVMYYLKENVDSVLLEAEFQDMSGKVLRKFATDSDAKTGKIKKEDRHEPAELGFEYGFL